MFRFMRRRTLAVAASVLVGTASLVAVTPVGPSGHVTPEIGARPHYRALGHPSAAASDVVFDCQRADAEYPCYGPGQIQHSYRVDALLKRGITGAGHTIVIIDAFQNPYARQELHDFDAAFGLPDPPRFDIVAPGGLTPFDPDDGDMVGWSGEISLDVQWAHSIAPGANITLVLAKSDNDPDINQAIRYAVNHNLGDVISMSFGEGQTCMKPRIESDMHAMFQDAVAKRITLISSSGDTGAASFPCDGSDALIRDVSAPAADPLVLGVGGTNLTADFTTGKYGSEDGWSSSGGGVSALYSRPDYQVGANPNRGRGVPDVSYHAGDPNGFIIAWYAFEGPGQFFSFYGTSAGAPQWAGLTALANDLGNKRVGFINDDLYHIAKSGQYANDFHDITTGDNTVPGFGGFRANRNWDAVTGLGSPIAATLVPDLAAA